MFSCEFSKIFKNTFFTEHLRTTSSDFSFQKQPPEVFYEKRCSWEFRKIHRKTLLVCKIFKNTFLQNTPGRLLLAFSCNATKIWYCQQCLDEYSLSTNTNFRSTVQAYHFFLGSIKFQCMFSLVYTVYCQKQSSE